MKQTEDRNGQPLRLLAQLFRGATLLLGVALMMMAYGSSMLRLAGHA